MAATFRSFLFCTAFEDLSPSSASSPSSPSPSSCRPGPTRHRQAKLSGCKPSDRSAPLPAFARATRLRRVVELLLHELLHLLSENCGAQMHSRSGLEKHVPCEAVRRRNEELSVAAWRTGRLDDLDLLLELFRVLDGDGLAEKLLVRRRCGVVGCARLAHLGRLQREVGFSGRDAGSLTNEHSADLCDVVGGRGGRGVSGRASTAGGRMERDLGGLGRFAAAAAAAAAFSAAVGAAFFPASSSQMSYTAASTLCFGGCGRTPRSGATVQMLSENGGSHAGGDAVER